MRTAFNGLLLALVAFAACLIPACSTEGGGVAGAGGAAAAGGAGGTGGATPGTTPVGPEGGVANSASSDGTVAIPAGAIASGILEITVEQRDRADFPDPSNRWSDVFELGPDGTNFDLPVTVAVAVDEDRTESAGTLWILDDTMQAWEEVELSYTSQGRVWGQVTHFSTFAAGPASAPSECTIQDPVALRTPGNVEVLVANLERTDFIGVGTLFEQEVGSSWITLNESFTVQGLAGPPEGQGRWIDYATGPNFENGVFDIAADGSFTIPLSIPPLGFRYLALTDACLGPFVSDTNGWLYNLQVFCGENCGQPVNAPPCQFPETVTMEFVPNSMTSVSVNFGFLENEECTLGDFQGLVRLLSFSRNVNTDERAVVVIAGLNRWTILSNSAGTEFVPGGRWIDLPDGTDMTMVVQDADDMNAPTYELNYRFDGNEFTVRSFIEL